MLGLPLGHRGALLAMLTVLVLVLALYTHLGEAHRALPGFWCGESGFLDEAGLTSMYLHIEAPPGGAPGAFARLAGRASYDAFLLMSTADGLICNQAVRLRARLPVGLWRSGGPVEGACELEFEDADAAPLPEGVRLALNPQVGTLALHADGALLAFMHKDAGASEAAI